MAVVLGRLLGIAFLVCFGTGLYSHFLQNPLSWMVFPTRPQSIYQLSQGIHITAGIACFPLILGKLYVVFPDLFQTPPITRFAASPANTVTSPGTAHCTVGPVDGAGA